MSESVDATFYAQIEPKLQPGYPDTIVGASVVRLTQTRPSRPLGGAVLVKLTLRLPKTAFAPLESDVVEIPESHTEMITVVEPPGATEDDD